MPAAGTAPSASVVPAGLAAAVCASWPPAAAGAAA